jgi:hypothetical protein
MPSFTTPEPIELVVDLSVGHVDVVAEDTATTTAEVVPSRDGKPGDRSLAESSTVDFDGRRLRVVVPKRLNLFGRNDSVDVRVVLPTGSDVTVRSAYGAVRLRGRTGRTRVDAKYGGASIEETADLVVSAPYGAIDVRAVRGSLDLDAGHGAARIGSVDGPATIRAAHGSVDLGDTRGPVDARLSGTLTIGTAFADVTAKSAHGLLRVESAAAGVVRLENGFAPVEVGVPAGTAAWVDATSEHGSVRNELTSGPAAEATERTVELHLSSQWADVLVRRATSSA